MVNTVNIIPVKHRHVSILSISTLAFSSKAVQSLALRYFGESTDMHVDAESSVFLEHVHLHMDCPLKHSTQSGSCSLNMSV